MRHINLKRFTLWLIALALCLGLGAFALADGPAFTMTVTYPEGQNSVTTLEDFTLSFDLPEGTTAVRCWTGAHYAYLYWFNGWQQWMESGHVEMTLQRERSGNYDLRAEAYTGELPENGDWEALPWDDDTAPVVKSNTVPVTVTADGPADLPNVALSKTSVSRGEPLEYTINDFGTDVGWIYCTAVNENGEAYGVMFEDLEVDVPVTYRYGTATLEPGSYKLSFESYAPGKDPDTLERPFTVTGAQLPDSGVIFTCNKYPGQDGVIDVSAAEEFILTAYAPGAERIEVVRFRTDNDRDDPNAYEVRDDEVRGSDTAYWEFMLDESDEYELFARAWYEGEDEPRESDRITFRATSEGHLEPCGIDAQTMVPSGQDYTFTVYDLFRGEDSWWDVNVEDRTAGYEILRLNDNDGIPEGGVFTIPADRLQAGHDYHIGVWVDAWGMDGAHSDVDFYVYDPQVIGDGIVLNVMDELEPDVDGAYMVEVRQRVRFKAMAGATENWDPENPADGEHGPATAFLTFNGVEWHPQDIADDEGSLEWDEEMDPENVCYAVRATYDDLSRFWNEEHDDFHRHEFEEACRSGEINFPAEAMSNIVYMNVSSLGQAPEAHADIFDDGYTFDVTRGRMLRGSLFGYGPAQLDDGTESYDVMPTHWRAWIVNSRGDRVSDDWARDYIPDDEIGGTPFAISTEGIRPGEGYRVVMLTGARGFRWTARESAPFEVKAPEADVTLDVSNDHPLAYENFEFCAYAQGAEHIDIYWRNKTSAEDDYKNIWHYGGDCLQDGWSDGSGEYEIFARAWYPEGSAVEYNDSEPIDVTITSLGKIDEAVIEDLPARINSNEDLTFAILPVENATNYRMELFWMGRDGDEHWQQLYREEYDLNAFSTEEGREAIYVCIPQSDAFAEHGEGIYRVGVEAWATGYRGSSIGNRFLVTEPIDEPDVVLTLGKEVDGEWIEATDGVFNVDAFETFHVSVNAPGAKAVRVYNDEWREYWEDDDPDADGFQVEFDWDHGMGYYSWFAQGLYDVQDLDENGDPAYDEDDNEQWHEEWRYTSNAVRVYATAEGRLDEPELTLALNQVARGGFLNVDISPVSGAQWYDLEIYTLDENDDSDTRFYMGGMQEGETAVPTARLEPGTYYVCVFAQGRGYISNDVANRRRYRFKVTEPEEPTDVFFTFYKTDYETREPISGAICVPGANRIRVFVDDDPEDEWGLWDGDSAEFNDWWFADPGEHSLTLQALFMDPDSEDFDEETWNNPPSWRRMKSETFHITAEHTFNPELFDIPQCIHYGEGLNLYPCHDGAEEAHLRIEAWDGNNIFDRNGTGFEVPASAFEPYTNYRVYLDLFGRNYEALHLERYLLVTDGETSEDICLEISKDELLVNERTRISAWYEGYLGESTGVRVLVEDEKFGGCDFCEFDYDFDQPGDYPIVVQVGEINYPDSDSSVTEDWTEEDWAEWIRDGNVDWRYTSDVAYIHVDKLGDTGVAEVEVPDSVTWGEFLNITVHEAEYADRYDIRIEDEAGSEWYYVSRNTPGAVSLPTMELEPDMNYRVKVSAGDRIGYTWSDTSWDDYWFHVDSGSGDAVFSLSKTELLINEAFLPQLYVPGASSLKVMCDSYEDDQWAYIDDYFLVTDPWYFDENSVPGEDEAVYHFTAYAQYEGEEEWQQVGEPIEVTVSKRGDLEPPVLEIAPIAFNDQAMITLHEVENADHYYVEAYRETAGGDRYVVLRRDLRASDFDENSVVHLTNERSLDEFGIFTVEAYAYADMGWGSNLATGHFAASSANEEPREDIKVIVTPVDPLIEQTVHMEAYAPGAKGIVFITPGNEQVSNMDFEDGDDEMYEHLGYWFSHGEPGIYPIFVEAMYPVLDENDDPVLDEYDEVQYEWYASAPILVEFRQLGYADVAGIEVPENVDQGDFLTIVIHEASNAANYHVRIHEEGNDDPSGLYYLNLNSPGAYDIPIDPSRFEPGQRYRVQVSTGGKPGYHWNNTDENTGWFTVNEPEEALDRCFKVSKTNLLRGEPVMYMASAPGAEEIRIDRDGEECLSEYTEVMVSGDYLGTVEFYELGTHTIAAYSRMEGSEEWEQIGETIELNVVNSGWSLDEPELTVPASVIAGEPLNVSVSAMDHADIYRLEIYEEGSDCEMIDADLGTIDSVDVPYAESIDYAIDTTGWPLNGYRVIMAVNSYEYGYEGVVAQARTVVVLPPDEEHPVTIGVDKTEVVANEQFEVTVSAAGASAVALCGGEGPVQYRQGDGFIEDYSLDKQGTYQLFAKACYDEIDWDTVDWQNWDWEELNWTATSQPVEVNVTSNGQMHLPDTFEVQPTVSRGDLLNVTFGDSEDLISWYDVRIRDEDWNECYLEHFEEPGTCQLPTYMLTAGQEYYVIISVGGEGYGWNETAREDGAFTVTEAVPGVHLNVDGTEKDVYEDLYFSIFAPDAESVRLVCDRDGEEYWNYSYDGEYIDDYVHLEESGDYLLRAEAMYDGEWNAQSEEVLLRVNPIGILAIPEQVWTKVVYQGDPIRFSFTGVDDAEGYRVGIIDPADFGKEGGPWCIQYEVQPGDNVLMGGENLPAGVTYIVGVDPYADGWELPPIEEVPAHRVAVVDRSKVLTLPAALKTISQEAFAGVDAQMIVLPSGVTSIGSRAFADCPNLVAVISPISIPDAAFDGCGHEVVVADKVG